MGLFQDLLLSVEGGYNHSGEEIKDEEVSKDDEEDEEKGPVNILVAHWLVVDGH